VKLNVSFIHQEHGYAYKLKKKNYRIFLKPPGLTNKREAVQVTEGFIQLPEATSFSIATASTTSIKIEKAMSSSSGFKLNQPPPSSSASTTSTSLAAQKKDKNSLSSIRESG